MNYFILPNIDNKNINKYISFFSIPSPPPPSQPPNKYNIQDTLSSIIINKTLYQYLLEIKEQIDFNVEQWDKYKKFTNPYEYIHTIIPNTKQSISSLKPLSRSFFKMVEICKTLNVLEQLFTINQSCKSFHLAEGPGGFIEALAFMRKNPNDTYYGMSLIDDTNQNVPGWKKSNSFLQKNPNVIIEKGITGNGDIMNSDNLRYCYDTYNGQMDLITGDGGFDFSCQYPQQEQISSKLILCQIAFAIAMQKKGGTFILKFFDTFTQVSIDILFLLSNLYHHVYIIKPNTSRFANSEKYVVCKDFKNYNTIDIVKKINTFISVPSNNLVTSFIQLEIPYFYKNKIEEYNAILGQQQIDIIINTFSLIDNINKFDKIEHMKKKNIQKCILWCKKFNIPYNQIIQTNNIFLNNIPSMTMTILPLNKSNIKHILP